MPEDTLQQEQPVRQRIQGAAQSGDGAALVSAIRMLSASCPSAGDYSFAAARLKELGAEGARKAGLKPLRTYIARSVTVEPLLPHLMVHAALRGLWLETAIGGYGSFIDDLMNPEGALAQFKPDLVLFLSDLEDVAGSLTEACAQGAPAAIAAEAGRAARSLESMLESLRRITKARIVAQGMVLPDEPVLGEIADANLAAGEGRAVQSINEALAAACRKIGDAVYFDQDLLAARYGRAAWRDWRMFYASRLAVAPRFFAEYAQGLARAMRALYFAPKKVLCTDLDDTLWGGIVGEDGPEGVATGAAFPGVCYLAYQKYLKQLAARGVLLAVVSKNNHADAAECFKLRCADLALTLEDFVGVKIGWDDKAASLRALAQELSLGLDSFVFVDDNPVECAAVRSQLPEVLVVEAPRNEPWKLVPMVASLGAFDTLAITEDDRNRVDDYRAQARRAELESSASSREEFLATLGIECTILSALDAPLSRSAQLIAKTNQFNLTTRRHSAGDIERIAQKPGNQALALRVRDRFGDAGVVGIALCEMEGDTCRIDTFLLSCRVIGRGIESMLLWQIARQAKADGAARLAGEYISSAKNQLCKDFYASHGFERLASDGAGAVRYGFDLNKGLPEKPHWIKLNLEDRTNQNELTTSSAGSA